jgi:Fe-S cluster assembly protein SufD
LNPQHTTHLEKAAVHSPEWLNEQRRNALERFEDTDMPSEKLDNWRYVTTDFDLGVLPIADGSADPLPADPLLAVDAAAGTAVIVDGTVRSVTTAEAVTFAPLAGAWDGVKDLVEAPEADADKLELGHSAFASDGVLLRIPRGTSVAAPFVIEVQAVQADAVSYPQIAVVLDDGAHAQVVVSYRSGHDGNVLLPKVDLSLGQGATLGFTAVQTVGQDSVVAISQKMEIGRDASVHIGEVGLGGELGRLSVKVDLTGDGSSIKFSGVSLGGGSQTLDYRFLVRHIGKNTSSDVYLKGAVDNAASSVFTGLLRIEEGALRTSAFETNRNLVLSKDAKAQSVPNLEILCDDVVCGHASTVGELDEEHLYYLQSRGLSHERAERILVHGFFGELLDLLPSQEIARNVRSVVLDKYAAGRVAAGRA